MLIPRSVVSEIRYTALQPYGVFIKLTDELTMTVANLTSWGKALSKLCVVF